MNEKTPPRELGGNTSKNVPDFFRFARDRFFPEWIEHFFGVLSFKHKGLAFESNPFLRQTLHNYSHSNLGQFY